MDDSWRLHHSIQPTSICPTCSTSHFPFCPPFPPYNPSLHRPYFDPIPPNRSYTDPINRFDINNFDNDRAVKRIRFGEIDSVSAENQRRLSLIRDHGAQFPQLNNNGYSHPPRPIGHSFYDSIVSDNNRATQILHQESVFDARQEYIYSEFERKGYSVVAPKHFDSLEHNSLHHSNVLGYEREQNLHFHGHRNDSRLNYPPPVAPRNLLMAEHSTDSFRHNATVYPPLPPLPPPAAVDVYPPLPPLPPPSLPMEPPGPPPPTHLQARISPPSITHSSPEVGSYVHSPAIQAQAFPPRNPSPEKPRIIDASSLFKSPNRESRPDHIVVILRGLPGSGKSYVAKMLRDLEVENGANAPRIHSMDDYFMTEVEKVEESEGIKSSGSARGKKRVTKKVMEYCYEPEMEEAYRTSMLKAFKKTVEDGAFTFIIVDDRNLRVADFAQFWACAKRAGYEVYLLEAMYKDPVGCAARNIHGFATEDIQKMAELWEEAPSLYLRLDIQSLFHGDDLKGNEIQEVDMDMDDVACDEGQSELPNRVKTMEHPADNFDDSVKDDVRWDTEVDDQGVKELGRSKWSHDADEEDVKQSEHLNRASNALSGLIQAYAKGDKSVRWGDQVGKTGFSIGARKRSNVLSLVIGPGSGYNLKSNPLPEEENGGASDISWQSKKRGLFEEQLRAERASERESVKAVVDRRRHRIAGLAIDDEVQ